MRKRLSIDRFKPNPSITARHLPRNSSVNMLFERLKRHRTGTQNLVIKAAQIKLCT